MNATTLILVTMILLVTVKTVISQSHVTNHQRAIASNPVKYNFNFDNSYLVMETVSYSSNDPQNNQQVTQPVTSPEPVSLNQLKSRLSAIEMEFIDVVTKPSYMLTHPAIRDVTVPSTARFDLAWARAKETIEKDSQTGTTSSETIKLVKEAECAWNAAMEMAEKIGTNGLTQSDARRARRLVERIINPVFPSEVESDKKALAALLNKVTYDSGALSGEKIIDPLSFMFSGNEMRKAISAKRNTPELETD